jgi:hypothetical protein
MNDTVGVADKAFAQCEISEASQIIIPKTVQYIGDESFSNIKNFNTLKFDFYSQIINIGVSAFSNNASLISVDLCGIFGGNPDKIFSLGVFDNISTVQTGGNLYY